jgi:hypothetical protein
LLGFSAASNAIRFDANLQPRQAADPCSAQCGNIDSAASSCTDDACFCPTLIAQGPQCTGCWQTVNVTEASAIASIMTQCQLELASASVTQPPASQTPSSPTACSAQCAGIDAAASSCTNDACFCPTLIAQAPKCTACWASVNATEAGLIASIYSGCQSELGTASQAATAGANPHSTEEFAPQTTGPVATGTSGSSSQTGSGSVATTSHKSSAGIVVGMSMNGMGYFQTVVFLSILAGFFGIFI